MKKNSFATPLLATQPLIIQYNGENHVISPHDIIYVEARTKCSIIHLNSKPGGICVSAGIGSVFQKLPQSIFCRIHRSFFINLGHIIKINKSRTRIYYRVDKTLPLTARYIPDLMNKFCVIR